MSYEHLSLSNEQCWMSSFEDFENTVIIVIVISFLFPPYLAVLGVVVNINMAQNQPNLKRTQTFNNQCEHIR